MLLEGRYRLRDCRGEGSFGTVYAADELLRGKRVGRCCLKIMLPGSDEQVEMFREISHLARVFHPRVVSFRGCGEVRTGTLRGSLYLAMELGERSLRSDLERAALSPDELLEVVQALAEGLAFLHEQGLVHRDVKPDNLLLCNGSWKLSDFGLARTLASLAKLGPLPGGTLAYKAPEIFAGSPLGTGVDLWALGVIVQESLTGVFPFGEEFAVDDPLWLEPVVDGALLEPFGWLARGCLTVDPSLRMSASEVLESLAVWRARRPLAESWLNECDRMVFLGSYAAALARMRKLAVWEPGLREALAGRYDQLLHLGLPPDLCGELHLDLGRLYLATGHLELARRVLEDCRRLYPDTPGALLALGEVYRLVLPDNAEVLELLAGLYEKAGSLRRAADAYRELAGITAGRVRDRARKRLEALRDARTG